MQTPVAFLIFNRPETTARVFAAIRQARPPALMVIGDGPREQIADPATERKRVQQTRKIVAQVDWDCDVQTLYSDQNLGCKQRVASGLDWAFSHHESLIVLEDDCLPDPTFFDFCEQLLDRYRDDERVMMISGDNFQPHSRTPASYYFSRWAHIWGWASWRSAWKHFDIDISSWPQLKTSRQLSNIFDCDDEYQHWSNVLDRQHAGQIDTWDFPWAYACWRQDGMTILPDQNLVANIGFGSNATHTTDPESRLANLPTHPMGPLRHPDRIEYHREADRYTWETIFKPADVAPAPRAKQSNWFRKLLGRAS